jgi:hypothetical protein
MGIITLLDARIFHRKQGSWSLPHLLVLILFLYSTITKALEAQLCRRNATDGKEVIVLLTGQMHNTIHTVKIKVDP